MKIITDGVTKTLEAEQSKMEQSFSHEKIIQQARKEFISSNDKDLIIKYMKSPLQHEEKVLRLEMEKKTKNIENQFKQIWIKQVTNAVSFITKETAECTAILTEAQQKKD